MDDYKELYCKLFNKITDVINELQTVQMETEKLFISQVPEQTILQLPAKNIHTV